MEHCLHWHVIDEADMVLIEYAVNLDDNDKEGELASFERMLRKLLADAPSLRAARQAIDYIVI